MEVSVFGASGIGMVPLGIILAAMGSAALCGLGVYMIFGHRKRGLHATLPFLAAALFFSMILGGFALIGVGIAKTAAETCTSCFSDGPVPEDKSGALFSSGEKVQEYPGFFIEPDKSSYAPGDTMLLTLRRADGGKELIPVDLYVSYGGRGKILLQSNVMAGFNTVHEINLNEYPVFKDGGMGSYTIIVCKQGDCGTSARMYTNAISITISPLAASQSSITVLAPNGGEKWMAGNTYSIRWDAQGVEKVIINIIDYTYSSELAGTIASGVPAFQGTFVWTIPLDIFNIGIGWQAGDQFKIFIAELKADNRYGVQDESNATFTLLPSYL